MFAHVLLSFSVAFMAFIDVESATIPADFKLCKRSDPKLAECLARNAEDALQKLSNGNKDLGIVPLEPLQIPEMRTLTDGTVKMEQIYTNVELHGLTKSKVEKFDLDFEKKTIEMITYSPSVKLLADYQMKGQMSVMTFNSHGKTTQDLDKYRIRHSLKFELTDKNGKEHIHITDYDVEFLNFDLHLDFTDLLPGNMDLQKELLQAVKENANSIFQDIKRPYEVNLARLFMHLANQFFDRVPVDDFLLK